MKNSSDDRPGSPAPGEFPETRWSQVVLAAEEKADAHQALEQLCHAYWQPIYCFLRRRGYAPHDAEDLTQQFFFQLLQRNSVARADRTKGRFRTFLLGASNHSLTDELRKNSAQKRGGTASLAANFAEAEERYLQEPDPGLTPEQMYDRHWAASLLQQAFELLVGEFDSAGSRERFDQLKRFLADQPADGEYDRLAPAMGMTARAVGAAVYRMRQRYRQLIRSQIADTVAGTNEIEAELAQLFG